MSNNRVVNILKTNYPLIQAPMSWLTDAKLAAAVSNAGGLGVLGPNAGAVQLNSDPVEMGKVMEREIEKTKELTDRPFGITIILPETATQKVNPYLAESLKVAFKTKMSHFITIGEPHQELFDLIKKNQGLIIHRPITPTKANFKLAEKFGADLLVATGYDEGGLLPTRGLGTFTAVPSLVDSVSIPVLAAGGITDTRGVQAAFALGAEGVYIGTRFIVTKESRASASAKERIIQSTVDDLTFISTDQRSLKTKTAMKLHSLLDAGDQKQLAQALRAAGGARIGMLEGNLDVGIASVGTGIDLITDIPSVADLVERLMAK